LEVFKINKTTMDKIEKLEERKDMYIADDSSFIEFLNKRAIQAENKLNEVIDYLNQSQKQPEVDVVEAFKEMEEMDNMTPEEFNKSKYTEPEKQPEGEDAKIRLLNEAMLSVIKEELDKRKK
jgi:hypothetical protein